VAFLSSRSECSGAIAVAESLRADAEGHSRPKARRSGYCLGTGGQREGGLSTADQSSGPVYRNRIAEEAHNALVKAVTDRGISVEEYTSILHLAENDPGVREKLLQRIHPPAD